MPLFPQKILQNRGRQGGGIYHDCGTVVQRFGQVAFGGMEVNYPSTKAVSVLSARGGAVVGDKARPRTVLQLTLPSHLQITGQSSRVPDSKFATTTPPTFLRKLWKFSDGGRAELSFR